LVPKARNLPNLQERLKTLGAGDHRAGDMAHGQKQNRFVACTFLDKKHRRAWRKGRCTPALLEPLAEEPARLSTQIRCRHKTRA
ncbi:RlmF-related methyltransferase, partial [Pseudomonas aeruginosa]